MTSSLSGHVDSRVASTPKWCRDAQPQPATLPPREPRRRGTRACGNACVSGPAWQRTLSGAENAFSTHGLGPVLAPCRGPVSWGLTCGLWCQKPAKTGSEGCPGSAPPMPMACTGGLSSAAVHQPISPEVSKQPSFVGTLAAGPSPLVASEGAPGTWWGYLKSSVENPML